MKNSISKDEDNGNNKNGNNNEKIKKRKTKVSKIRNDSKNSEMKESNQKTRKVKFNSNVEIIDVECWKAYNYEQTADENFDAFFYEENDYKNKKDINNSDEKRKKNKDEISCTCNII